jgi:hypothetical protein
MKNKITALFVATAGFASAATIVQTEVFSFVPLGDAPLTFDYFDTMGGTRTLTGVTINITYTKSGGSLTADNDSAVAGTISMSHIIGAGLDVGAFNMSKVGGGSVAVAGTPLKATSTVSGASVGATSGDATNAFNVTGLDDNYVYTASDQTITSSGNLSDTAQFAGAGNFTWTFDALQTSSITGLSGVNYALVNSQVDGSVTVTYSYIPEPSAALLGGLGMLCLLRRRR